MLAVCVFVCAMMALTRAAAVPEEMDESEQSADLVKRFLFWCSSGWTRINGRCFIYIPKPLSWAKAEKKCQSMGAHLASLNNIQEYHEIQKMIVSITHDYPRAWLGGSDAQGENIWLWSDGKAFTYSEWCRGEPNNHGGEHCLEMNYGDKKCWNDWKCNKHLPSVCVK